MKTLVKALVVGADGQLGTDVCKAFEDTELFRGGDREAGTSASTSATRRRSTR